MLKVQTVLRGARVDLRRSIPELVQDGKYDSTATDVVRYVEELSAPPEPYVEMDIRAVSPGRFVTTDQLSIMLGGEGHTALGLRSLLAVGAQVPILQHFALIVCLGEPVNRPDDPLAGPERFANLWGTATQHGLGVLLVDEKFEWRPDDLFLVA